MLYRFLILKFLSDTFTCQFLVIHKGYCALVDHLNVSLLVDYLNISLLVTIIPTLKSWRNCTSLFRIRLERNQLAGSISIDFGIYPQLHYMDLSDNKFYGELSQEWKHFRSLITLKISKNNLSSEMPSCGCRSNSTAFAWPLFESLHRGDS